MKRARYVRLIKRVLIPGMEIYYAIEVPLTRSPRRMLGKVLSNFTAAVRGIGNRRIDLEGWREAGRGGKLWVKGWG